MSWMKKKILWTNMSSIRRLEHGATSKTCAAYLQVHYIVSLEAPPSEGRS